MQNTGINFMARNVLIIASGLTLAACGGGGGGGSDGDSASRTVDSVAESEFLEFAVQDGVWRATIDGHFKTTQSLADVKVVVNSAFAGAGIFWLQQGAGNTFTEDDCSVDEPTTYDTDDFSSDDYSFDEDDGCDSDLTFVKVDDSTYKITQFCGGLEDTVLTLTHLSDVPVFNHGTLTFAMDSYSNLNANTGVCGSKYSSKVSSKVSPQPNSLSLEDETFAYSNFSVVAPYEGTRVEVEFDIDGPLSVGTYDLGSGELAVSSKYFSGMGVVESFGSESGTLTVTNVTQYTIEGNFNALLENGDGFEGNFSLDIR